MTKLKNTKKGMAKKALSISLVAAMLATSNVPVWAAEDLFTDGSSDVAVEAPSTEVETFSAEETEAAVQTQATSTNDTYSVDNLEFSNVTNNSAVWDQATYGAITANFSISGDTEGLTFYYAWKINGLADNPSQIMYNGSVATNSPVLEGSDAGSTLTLYVFARDIDNNIVWEYNSDAIAIEAVDETNAMAANITLAETTGEYTGQAQDVRTLINWGNATASNYNVTVSGDTTNVSDDGVTVTVTANRTGYTGRIELHYDIAPGVINDINVDDMLTATLNTTEFVYTGNAIKIPASAVTLVDDNGNDISNYLQTDSDGYISYTNELLNTGSAALTLNLIAGQPTSGNKNYNFVNGLTIQTTNRATVTARDLSTVDIEIQAQSIPADGTTLDLESEDVTFTDSTTGEELNLFNDVSIELTSTVTAAGNYSVEVTPKEGNGNVTGEATADIRIVAASLSGATFTGEEARTSEEYTGEAITKTAEQLGQLQLNGTVIDSSLYDISYANNINAGIAQIIVSGKAAYEGSTAVIPFTINAAAVSNDTITVNSTAEHIDTQDASDYKGTLGLVVTAENADGQEFTLTEDEDYTVTYAFSSNGDIGDTISATITITNTNFIGGGSTFDVSPIPITAKNLQSEYIQLTETEFTYTGSPIEPDFDIVIDGKIINPSHYNYSYSNNINAGTATLTVWGDGDNYSTARASVTYTINPADVSSLEGTIASKEYTGYSLTLEENDFNLTLNGEQINVNDNFTLTYGTNVEIGEGTVTLTPKNNNFTGTLTLTFQIIGHALNEGGAFAFYDANGIRVTDPHGEFTYDGTTHEFAQTVFTYNGTENLIEGEDYDLVYVDNVYGKELVEGSGNRYGAVLAVAKGEYGSTRNDEDEGLVNGVYTDNEGTAYANVIAVGHFRIEQEDISRSNVSVSNGVYAAGLQVEPAVSIIVNGVRLIEGQDYELTYRSNDDRVNATTSNSLRVTVTPINGYEANGDLSFNWGIDQFNLANADITVDGDTVTVKCGRVDVETSEYTVTRDEEANTVTVTAVEDSQNYTGSQTVEIEVEPEEPEVGQAIISNVRVSGNTVTPILSGDVDGAVGYDYVISTSADVTDSASRVDVSKNILTTNTNFYYVEDGTYYVYCHAWKRDENGLKVFGEWSNVMEVEVTAITPERPMIQSARLNGRTLTVTWTRSENATGYDIVMGTAARKVNGEMRPVDYGKAVKKITNGDTVTVTFRSIPDGTYYVGLHAWNRTSESGVKVFSPWSNGRRIVVG